MKQVLGFTSFALVAMASPAWAEQPLFVAYPPTQHETTANQIFLIGTAPPQGEVLVNGKPIVRNTAGHFAPSFPLQMGENQFTLRYQSQEIKLAVTRIPSEPEVPTGLTFAKDSLTPNANIARLPDELLCFGAIAPPKATVSVKLADQVIPLAPQPQTVLPANSAVLTNQNQPSTAIERYQGCTRAVVLGDLGIPSFQLTIDGKTTTQPGTGNIQILSPTQLQVAEVSVEAGVARTGPSTDYSRLTPLPKGTRATITGSEGDWLRLDYGAWINRQEVQILENAIPPHTIIRSIRAQQNGNWTDVVFPLQVPVPVSVQQGDRTFTLTLHHTTAQTDTIRLDDNPLIARLDWQQVTPTQVQYTFNLKANQQWGYKLRYEGTSLILSLKHPPASQSQKRTTSQSTTPPQRPQTIRKTPTSGTVIYGNNIITGVVVPSNPLSGTKILLDPGHGGPEDLGARGPTGYPEKDVTLLISKLVQEQLVQRGATVVMTRETDRDVTLLERVALINQEEPAIALSLHYNALPDNGDALKTQGISTFWYNPQAHDLAIFLHNYLVEKLQRPSYGVYWNNLALTRPTTAPAVLLELGFMINPDEFEWITNSQAQKQLAGTIAEGITLWILQNRQSQEL
jgi:N-acetylmuramoyl-L-alanine amidase